MRKKSGYIVGALLLTALTLIIYNTTPHSDYGMKVMGVIGIVQLIYSIYSWAKITGAIITPYVIFLIAAYTFTFGQSILYVFGKVALDRDLTNLFSAVSIMPALNLTLIFLNFFHIGGLLSCRSDSGYSQSFAPMSYMEEHYRQNQIIGVRKIGILFLGISIIPYLIERVILFSIVSTTGYSGLYTQDVKIGLSNITSILSQYFIPGVLCLLLVETSKLKKYVFITLLILEACFWLYTGGRSNGVIIAAILLMYFHICVKPIKLKQAIVIAVAGFFFISLLGVISKTRVDPNANIKEIMSDSFSNSNAFYSAVSEMGGSMYPMITTMELVPARYDFKYGASYLYAASSIIPNLGFWDLHPAMKYGNMNDWLQNAMNLSYGPGFSIVAEAYVNFGNWGFLMMLLLGYCFGLIFNFDIKSKRNPLLLVLSFIFCFLIIKTVRNSFLATVRSIFYYILPIYLFVVYYAKGKIISHKNT